MIFRRALALACLAPLLGAWIWQPAHAGQTRSFRIGVCLSLTGEFSASGKKALAGVKMRVEEHNSTVGPDGARIYLVVRDDRSDAATAAGIVEELATKDRLAVIIGPLSTNLMRGMRDAAHRLKVVLVSPSVTSPQIGRDRDWAFRLLFDDGFQGVALARYLYRDLGVKRVASLVNRHLAYANSVNQAFKKEFEALGGSMVREEFYEWVADEDDEMDFAPALDRLAGADPQMVLLPNNSTDIAAIVRQAFDSKLSVPFCGGDTWLHETILESAGNKVKDAVFVSGIDYESGTPEMKHFLDLYDHSYDPDAQPASVLGYDCVSLVLEALKKGGDAESIRDALYAIRDFPLATGVITIHPERGSEKSAYIRRIVEKDNAFVSETVAVVKP